jgi:uncharacterized protein (DUF362 family)/Pyruvate/2-oxoacid:ferredoxin oxidoreductase delta subunit
MMHSKVVSLYQCPDYGYPAVKAAIAKIGADLKGGWRNIILPGATVLLKPNLLKPATPEQAVSPHPAVVRAVAELCLEAGAGKIIIGDSPGFGTARKVAERCGILAVARDLGIEVVDFTESVEVAAPQGFVHRSFRIARQAAEADIIINLPKFKTHAMMVLTLAIKNLYGVLVGKQKARWHFQSGRDYQHFARLLLELAYTVRPAISILDAVLGMEGNGPGNGSPRRLGFLAGSEDMLCLDRVATEISGIDPGRVYTLQVAGNLGCDLGLNSIPLAGDPISMLRVADLKTAAPMSVEGPLILRPLSWPLRRFMTTRPAVDREACKGCGLCMQACPAMSISQAEPNRPISINHATCIRCFCCQELCPEGAIAARDALGVRILRAFGLE